MSIERELLKKVISGDDDGDFFISNALLKEIEVALAEPEQSSTTRHALDSYWNQEAYQRGYAHAVRDLKRELLGDGITADMYRANKKATHPDSYWAGVYDAEKAHGIGGGE